MDCPEFNAPLCEWALYYAKKGIPVFPCAPKTKVPAIPIHAGGKGVNDATTDLSQIRKWWAKYPAANIGAACGHKFDVVDVDGETGRATFTAQAKKSQDKIVAAVKTPSGGFHVYYSPTIVPLVNGVKRLPGLDLRTKGGYVLLPPSYVIQTDKGYEGWYEWREDQQLNGQPLPEMPRWAQEAFKPNREGERYELSERLEEGGRNDALFRFGCALRAKNCNEIEILVCLTAMNDARCSPPLPMREIEQIVQSVKKFPAGPSNNKEYWKPEPFVPIRNRAELLEKRESQFLKLSEIEGKPVDWLFGKRFAKGMLSALAGDPGEGKSTIARAMATMVTTGNAPSFWDMRLDGPRDVVWLTKEESLVYSVVPVLKAMGADLNRIHALCMDLDEDGRLPPDFVFDDWGIQQLRELVEATQAAMIVIDPLVAFFDKGTDIHRQNETRHTLARLIVMAEQTGCVPVGIVHQSKAKNTNALLNILGSVDFGAAVRTAFMVGHDPDDRTKKAFVQTKSNLGPFSDPLGFEIDDEGSILWDEHCTLDAERLNEPPSPKAKKEKGEACSTWLENELSTGQYMVNALLERARDQGFSRATLYRASDEIRVSRGYQPAIGHRGPAWWARNGYDWSRHEWEDPFE